MESAVVVWGFNGDVDAVRTDPRSAAIIEAHQQAREGKEAISEYVGKYLEAGLIIRKHSWKGCRRVKFDRRAKTAWLSCTRVFAWHSPGGIAWRKRVGELGAALGVVDMDGIRRKLGPKWAYPGALPHRECYQVTSLPHEKCYPTEADSLVVSCGKLSHVSSEATKKDGTTRSPALVTSRVRQPVTSLCEATRAVSEFVVARNRAKVLGI